jgi:hypothetical protein
MFVNLPSGCTAPCSAMTTCRLLLVEAVTADEGQDCTRASVSAGRKARSSSPPHCGGGIMVKLELPWGSSSLCAMTGAVRASPVGASLFTHACASFCVGGRSSALCLSQVLSVAEWFTVPPV